MSLLNRFKREALNQIIDTAKNAITGTPAAQPGQPQPYAQSQPYAPPQQNTGFVPPQSSAAGPEQYFDQILAAEFPDIQVIKNAPPEGVGIAPPSPCRPYSYALLRGGRTAAVMMLTPHNRDRNAAFLNAKKAAAASNVKFLNFYTHFSNERDYVVTRIRSAL